MAYSKDREVVNIHLRKGGRETLKRRAKAAGLSVNTYAEQLLVDGKIGKPLKILLLLLLSPSVSAQDTITFTYVNQLDTIRVHQFGDSGAVVTSNGVFRDDFGTREKPDGPKMILWNHKLVVKGEPNVTYKRIEP